MGGLLSKGNNNHFNNVKKIYKLVSGIVDIAAQFSYAGTEISEEQKKDYMDNLDKHGPISKEALLSQMQAKGYPKIHGKSNEDVDKILETMAMSIPSNIDLPVYVEPKKTEVAGGNPVYGAIVQGVISVANSPAGQGILLSVNDSAKKIVDDPGGYLMRIHKTIGPQAMVKDAFSTLNEIKQSNKKADIESMELDFEKDKKENENELARLKMMYPNQPKKVQQLFQIYMIKKQRNKLKPKRVGIYRFGGEETKEVETIMIAKIVVLVLFVIAFAVYFTYDSPTARNATLGLGGIYLCLFLFEKFY